MLLAQYSLVQSLDQLGGFREAVVACDMPELCKFPSLVSFQKSFLWAHEEVDLAPHQVTGLVLQVGDAEKFPQKLCFESPDLPPPFFFFFGESASRVHVSQP